MHEPRLRVTAQVNLLRAGAPIAWSTDLIPGHPAFVAGSLLAVHGGLEPERRARLDLRADDPADDDAIRALRFAAARLAAHFDLDPPTPPERAGGSWADVARYLAAPILAAADDAGRPDSVHGGRVSAARHDHE